MVRRKIVKNSFKKIMILYLFTQVGLICFLMIMGCLFSCVFKVSVVLLNGDLFKKIREDIAVIEVNYNDNILEKTNEVVSPPIVYIEPQVVVEKEVVVEPSVVTVLPVITTQPVSLTTVTNTKTGIAIANFALQYVGYPYVYGGSSLTAGADCSGFVMAVFDNFGINLPRTATAQSYTGTYVDPQYLQAGDLVFYGYGSIMHVGIYTFNGQIVHAMNETNGIFVSSYNFMPIISAIRVI